MVKGGGFRARITLSKTGIKDWSHMDDAMIIFFSVVLKDLFIKGRDYPWPMPDRCPRCNSCKLWGHGFAGAFWWLQSAFIPKALPMPGWGIEHSEGLRNYLTAQLESSYSLRGFFSLTRKKQFSKISDSCLDTYPLFNVFFFTKALIWNIFPLGLGQK